MPWIAIDKATGEAQEIRITDIDEKTGARTHLRGPGIGYGLTRAEVEIGLQKMFGQRDFWCGRYEIVDVAIVPASAVRFADEEN